jgi:hypothetical protein
MCGDIFNYGSFHWDLVEGNHDEWKTVKCLSILLGQMLR